MGEDQPLEVLDGGCRELETRHRLQLVDCDRPSGARLLEAELSTLKRARDAVQELDDTTRIDIGFIDCL
jgi:hypothetical protein